MISGHTLAKNLRQWGVVFGSGLAGLALGLILFSLYGLEGIFHALNTVPVAAGVALSLVLVLAFMAGGALFAVAQERWRNLLARIALNNMTQALCMYDAAGRLVLCNVRFIEMYNLRREQLRGGMPMRELLARGAEAGVFAGDPERYAGERIRRAAQGATDTKTFEMKNGRIVSLISRPLRGGGWVETHTDVTEQLVAERERDSLRLREERRIAIDADIASFRGRVENVIAVRCGDEAGGQDLAGHVGSHLAAGRRRGARLQRGFGQCRDRGGRRRRAVGLDQGDQPPARADRRCRAHRCRRRDRDQR